MDADEIPAPPFTNEAISADRVPRLADIEFTPLDPKLMTTSIVTTVAFWFVALAVSVALSIVLHPLWLLVALASSVGCASSILLRRIEIAHMGYAIRERDFSFRSGVLSRSVATVPFARVQHVTIESGPLERHFDLSTLELRTAGAVISVPGLRDALARDLKGLVVARAGELADAEADTEPELQPESQRGDIDR